jgi:REP element-mobilizing transposase RayT
MVRKGFHCAYDVHYHIVFPVKYRKALLSEPIVQYIKEIGKELEERYDLEIDTSTVECTPKVCPWSIGKTIQKYHSKTVVSKVSRVEERTVGRGILDRWILCWNCFREKQLEDC